MITGIDLRTLQDPLARGVSSYARSLITTLVSARGGNAFRGFAAGGLPTPQLGMPTTHLNLPSKLVNGSMRFTGLPTLDAQLGTKHIWMPNLTFWSVGSEAHLTVTVQDLSFIVEPTWYSMRGRLWHRYFINICGLLKRADAILTLSGHTKRELIELLNLPPEKIYHIPPGIPPVAETSGQWGVASGQKPYILFVGVVERRKNPIGALRAFERAAEKLPNHHLMFAGAFGTDANEARLKAQSSKLKARIHFLGEVSHEMKGALIRNADALFLSSHYEGFGFPPLEAMSVGVPTVTSTGGALPETVGNAGLMLDPLDTEGFARALVAVCTDPALRATLIACGYERVKQFSWERCAKETIKVISGQLAVWGTQF